MGTPRKTNLEVFGGKGCFICGRDEPNSRKRHSLGGRNACTRTTFGRVTPHEGTVNRELFSIHL